MIQNNNIHPTAIIEPTAVIGDGVTIGPYCVIGGQCVLGDRVHLKSHIVIDGDTHIGDDTQIFPFASIGTIPQDLKFGGEQSRLRIGKRNRIREQVTINPGTEGGGMETIIGDDNLLMISVHIAHDCRVGNHVIMANNATLAGHVTVDDHAILGGLSAVRQFIRIGKGAMIGGMSGVEADVIPYGMVVGERAHLRGLNLIGLQRQGTDKSLIRARQALTQHLFQGAGELNARLAEARLQHQDNPEFLDLLDFIDHAVLNNGLVKPNSK